MVKVVVFACLTAMVAGCASTGAQVLTKQVAYLDTDGKVKTKTVEYTVPAPKRVPMVTTYANQSLAFKG
jgi:predicted methyltransferase MtxX (methanogen marker protein 4)